MKEETKGILASIGCFVIAAFCILTAGALIGGEEGTRAAGFLILIVMGIISIFVGGVIISSITDGY